MRAPIGRIPNRKGRSEIPFEIDRRLFGRPFQIERRDEMAVAVHQIDQRGVIHRVVAILQRHLLGVDAIARQHLGDRCGIAGQALEVRIEARQIVLHRRSGVAFRIDRNEIGVHAVGVLAHRLQDLGNLEQRGRADVRAMGEAEEDQRRLALEVLVGDGLA
ncbi:hypothetical protein chiPu_0033032, partial [Chiloscyllium punctatum]|nr:hypothetical protein [Chiloscyllium punctatum]